MKIFANRKTKNLFRNVLMLMVILSLASTASAALVPNNDYVYVMIFSALACVGVAIMLYRFFVEQNKILEDAVTQIEEYISGNRDGKLECDEEGELYRLLHEVNSLVSIMEAHTQHKEQARLFLRDTLLDISHQLKTPLAALNIYNGIMQEEGEESPTIKEFTSLSERELDRIETLVQNLLKISKIDAGTLPLEKAWVNVFEMMEDIERQFSFRAENEGKHIILSGDDSVSLFCDYTWIVEAVANIVKNSFDHTKEGDTVSIEWKQLPSVVRICIKDNGNGIHPEDLYHIFKRFYRSRYSKDRQGIGLGLPLTKAIVEVHNGTIEVDSQLGVGTTFTINFLLPTKL